MSREQVPRITCDLCLRSLIEDEHIKFFNHQNIDICQHCCFVLQRSKMFSEDIIGAIMIIHNDTDTMLENTGIE